VNLIELNLIVSGVELNQIFFFVESPITRAHYCDECFYLSVDGSVCPQTYLRKHRSKPEFSEIVACGHDSLSLWWHCNTLCTFCGVNYIMFSYLEACCYDSSIMHGLVSLQHGTSCIVGVENATHLCLVKSSGEE